MDTDKCNSAGQPSDDCIKVAVRVRPLLEYEIERGCRVILDKTTNSSQICVNNKDRFTFNYAFAMDETQEMVYSNAVLPLVQNLFRGLNVTILAYGQTGSGKTHTMGTNFDGHSSDDTGLIPRAIRHIFEHIDKHSDAFAFEVTCSFIELYQEQLYDLLSTAPREQSIVDIREDSLRGVFIANLSELPADGAGDAIDCLVRGSAGRAVGSTAMNAASSRSHAIYTVNVRTTCRSNADRSTSAKFHLVDLAGSERSNKTKATGQRFKEGVKINQGLLALGNVISALGSAQRAGTHVSYRDSKLTRLLQDSLGGNSVTLMIACVSPADYNMDETLSTLRYADRAKQIRNKPIVNQDPKMAEINRLRQVVAKLRLELMHHDNPEQPPQSSVQRIKLQSSQDGDGEDGEGAGAHDNVFVVGSPRRPTFRRLSGMPSAEELTRLRGENMSLREDYAQLRGQLDRMLVNLSRVNLSHFALEQRAEQLMEGLQRSERIAVDLSTSFSNNDDPRFAELLDILRSTLTEQCPETVALDTGSQRSDTAGEPAEEPASVDNLDSTWIVSQSEQMQYNDQLMDLQQQIQLKTAFNARMQDNHRRLDEMNGIHVSLVDYTTRLATLESELSDARRAVDDAKRSGNKTDRVCAKLAEERRRRVQQLESEVRDLQKQTDKQQRLLRQQEAYKQQVAKQELELQRMKKLRVDLIKKVKETTDKANADKSSIKREHLRMEAKMRKEATELNAKRSKAEREAVVMKRKVESYLVANKRLKEAMEKHRSAQAQRNNTRHRPNSAHKAEAEIQALIDHEVEIIYSVVDAKHSLQQLIDDRANMNRRMLDLRRHARKRELGVEEKILVEQLEEEIETRNVQIADMQEKIRSSNVDDKIEAISDGLNSTTDFKTAVRYLFGSLTDLRVEFDTRTTCEQDLRAEFDEKTEEQRRRLTTFEQHNQALRDKCKQLSEINEANERSYEEKVSLLLQELGKRNQQHSVDGTVTCDVQQQINDDLLDKMRLTIASHAAKVIQLEKALAGRTARRQRQSFGQNSNDLSDAMDDDEHVSLDSSDDTERDPDWHKTPAKQLRRHPLREKSLNTKAPLNIDSSNSNGHHRCHCKGNCKSKLCGCRKLGQSCHEECGCEQRNESNPGRCENRSTNQSISALGTTVSLDKSETVTKGLSTANDENSIVLTPQRTILSTIDTTTPYPYEHKKRKPLLD